MNTATDMNRLLTEVLERMGISVERIRLEDHVSGGGLCSVRGKRIVYIDRNNSREQELRVLTEALQQLPELPFLPPAVRDWLDGHANQ
jgi:hypothetical protein